MADSIPVPAVHHVIDYAVNQPERKFGKLTTKKATFLGQPKMYTPMKEGHRAKLRKKMNLEGLGLEEAIAKALDQALEYWRQTNRGLINEARKVEGRNDITEKEHETMLKVKEAVLTKLTSKPELFRDDEFEHKDASTADKQSSLVEKTLSEPLSQKRRRDRQKRQLADNQGEQVAASGRSSTRLLRSHTIQAPADRNGTATQSIPDMSQQLPCSHHHQPSGRGTGHLEGRQWRGITGQSLEAEPRTPTRSRTRRTNHNQLGDGQADVTMMRCDPSPASDVTASSAPWRSVPGPRASSPQPPLVVSTVPEWNRQPMPMPKPAFLPPLLAMMQLFL